MSKENVEQQERGGMKVHHKNRHGTLSVCLSLSLNIQYILYTTIEYKKLALFIDKWSMDFYIECRM